MKSRRFNRSKCIFSLTPTGRIAGYRIRRDQSAGVSGAAFTILDLLRCTLHFRDGSIVRITAPQHWHPLHPSEQTLCAQNGGCTATLILWRKRPQGLLAPPGGDKPRQGER